MRGTWKMKCMITVPLDTEVFGAEVTIYLEHNDHESFVTQQEISAAYICLYVKRINIYSFLAILIVLYLMHIGNF